MAKKITEAEPEEPTKLHHNDLHQVRMRPFYVARLVNGQLVLHQWSPPIQPDVSAKKLAESGRFEKSKLHRPRTGQGQG